MNAEWVAWQEQQKKKKKGEQPKNNIDSLIDQLMGAQGVDIRYEDGAPTLWQGDEMIRDFSDYKQRSEELGNVIGGFGDLAPPDWENYRDNYDQYKAGFDQNLASLNNPDQRNQDVADARQYSAESLGYDNWDQHRQDVGNMRGQLNQGIGGMEGLSDIERQKYAEFQDRQALEMRDSLNRQAESVMASTGSTMNFLMAADEARKQVSNERLRGELSIMQEDFQRKSMQFEGLKDQLWQQVQAGSITTEQFMQGIRHDRAAALQGYAMGMDQMLQKYSVEMQAYATEVQALGMHADAMYKSIMLDIGIDQAAIDLANSIYAGQVQPIIDNLNAALGVEELELLKEQNKIAGREETLWSYLGY